MKDLLPITQASPWPQQASGEAAPGRVQRCKGQGCVTDLSTIQAASLKVRLVATQTLGMTAIKLGARARSTAWSERYLRTPWIRVRRLIDG